MGEQISDERRYVTREVSFEVDGSRIAGLLYRPTDAHAPSACVVMATGFSGTMDWILPDFAKAFATRGLAVLTFDYRFFGRSGGEPRQLVDSRRQREDLRGALTYIRGHRDIDENRIALWGTSLGGSHVIEIASRDPNIAAVVANVPALDMYAGLHGRFKPPNYRPGAVQTLFSTVRLLMAATADVIRGKLGRPPRYIAVYGPLGHAVFSDPSLEALFREVGDQSPTWRNAVTPRFLFHAPRYRSGTAERVRCPLMVTLARDDAEISSKFVKEKLSQARLPDIREYPVGHFEVYHGAVRDEIISDQSLFLVRHLLTDHAPERG
ncbi:MAG: alpha/beta hydrolase [Mycolicibacterium sp.]|uniref:alpha/beta hydrolase n=1 Tax=Mycolicibacterium sp. TaxID=2320850 RepID=UPI003D0D52BA